MKRVIISALVLFGSVAAHADTAKVFDHSHSTWDGWLKKYVKQVGAATQVNYKAAKKDRSNLKTYLGTLSKITKAQYKSFADKQKLAFLINAYNAFTVELILNNYPIDSIKDTGSFFTSPWKKKFFTFLGEKQHLDGIEHGMIRKQFKEPRIHFAVNCASVGCPALRAEAWVADRLEAQFEDSTKTFLGDSTRNRYDAAKNELYLSKIFDWYGGDFEKAAGSVAKFVAPYMAKDDAQRAKIAKADVDHLDYDWNLNQVK